MKLSIAIVALYALPSVMGDGLDESCFLMPDAAVAVIGGARRLNGVDFWENPGNEESPGGINIHGVGNVNCADHAAIVALGFTKFTADEVCEQFIAGLPGGERCEEDIPNKDSQCQYPTGIAGCAWDQNWTCKQGMRDNGYIKGIHCGKTNLCKVGVAICALDPHFKTWADDDSWYDFHGQCDLKYMSDPEFSMGLGMEIDIRTKGRYEYSYIESAAIKLGDDVFEFSSFGDIHYNGVESAEVDGVKMAGRFLIEHTKDDKKHQTYTIAIRGKEYIEVSSFKDMVSLKVMDATKLTFGRTIGLMGDFQDGKLTSRDGKKVYDITDQEEMNTFGQEWQVLASEPNLFQTPSDPTQKCVMPSKTASAERKRRLGESAISEEVARAACATAKSNHIEMCVLDVMATADLEVASAGVY